jgi:EAL domain-containing protein (putative c-di-GMP-specific phosphodiesterase class I)
LIGAEALLRWFSPELGLVSPADFVPIAETSGLIRPLGEWVIREACRQKRAWEEQGEDGFPVSVNVSFRQLTAGSLPKTVETFLRETRLEAAHLDLEITENTIMDDLDTALETLRALKQIGVRVSIDDFGTGYSSLSVLGSLPADTLKIDQSFVRDIAQNPPGAAVTRAVIAVAEELGLEAVAEGVETREEMEFVAALGCVKMQGYLFGRPLPAEEFAAEWLDGDSDSPVKLQGS